MQRRRALGWLLLAAYSVTASAKELTVGAQVSENARLAVEQFQSGAGGRLDYSVTSLQAVEDLLAEASDYRESLKSSSREALIELLGCYILEIGHREHGGKFAWYEKRMQPVLVVGEPAFHVAIITFDKVRGRLSGDRGDNIPFFYEGFAERVRTATPGTNALYV